MRLTKDLARVAQRFTMQTHTTQSGTISRDLQADFGFQSFQRESLNQARRLVLVIVLKNAWSFTQKLTQNLSQSIWSIQLDDLLNYGRWEDNSISRLSCVTQFMTNMTNMISRTFLYLGQFQWCDAFTPFLIFLQKYKYFKFFMKKMYKSYRKYGQLSRENGSFVISMH